VDLISLSARTRNKRRSEENRHLDLLKKKKHQRVIYQAVMKGEGERPSLRLYQKENKKI
jgi:hypothetical protein